MSNADKINELLTYLASTVQAGTDFAIEQAPAVAQEIVAWSFAFHLFWAIACGIVAIAGLSLMLAGIVGAWRGGSSDDCASAVLLGLVVLAVFILPACVNTALAIKAKIAPRVVVIDWVSSRL